MKIIISVLSCLLLSTRVGPAQAISNGNAALQYWQAFLHSPQWESLSRQEQERLQSWGAAPLDQASKSVVDKYRIAIHILHRGAAESHCDWGLQQELDENGLAASTLHLKHALRLAQAVCLRGRLLHGQGKDQDVIADSLAAMHLARHVGSATDSSGKILEFGVEGEVTKLIASILAEIKDRKILARLRTGLEKLPPSRSMSDVIRRAESRMYVRWFKKKGLPAVETLIQDLGEADDERKELIRTFLGLEKENLPGLYEEIERRFNEAADLASLPVAQCAQGEQEWKAKLKREMEHTDPVLLNVLPRLILPPVAKLRFAECKMQAERAMLKAALTKVLNGDEAFRSLKDPFGKGPFSYREVSGGFELSSQLRDKMGRNMTLTVGSVRLGGK